jgi:RNA polymerase sigma-70 factor (ECF subfamily)
VVREEVLPAELATDLAGSFERLVLAYQGRLYRFALRLSGNPRDAEEIAQDAFVRAYRALERYPPERVRGLALRPWLYQIALNVTRNRTRGRGPRLVPLEATDERDGDGAGSGVHPALIDDERARPESLVERAEGGAELGRLVAALPGRYRAATILRHVEGLPYAEVAAILGQPVGTAKANVHRGVRILREALAAREDEVNGRTREIASVATEREGQ